MQLGLAMIMDDETHNLVRSLQLRVVRELGVNNPALKQVPHVTLKQPFHAKTLEPIEAYFDELRAGLTPIPLEFSGLGYFDDDRVVFLDLTPDEHRESLRRRILADLGARFKVKPRDIEDDRYHFHLTLAYGLTPEDHARARALLAEERVQLRVVCDTLGLFYYTGEEWIVYKRCRLG